MYVCESVYSEKGEMYATREERCCVYKKGKLLVLEAPKHKQVGPLTYPDPAPL